MTRATPAFDRRRDLRLALEAAGLFGVAPIAVAVLLPPSAMFPALLAVTLLGLFLLNRTPGFHWHELLRGRLFPGEALAFAAVCAGVSYVVVMLTEPRALFYLPKHDPQLMLTILLLYPVLSALPQELVFRPLFFRRYGHLLPPGAVLWVNAAVFSLAHLMYWSWIVAAMTFFGGLCFARAYGVQRSFPQAVLLHTVAGSIVFAFGLGMFFYTGNVERPF
ncbi:MAG: type II CAAX prenyl endopeptidase Rce1 family protein [Gemmobacter sp.]